MIGSILVNLIFPESEGGSENWTDTEFNYAFNTAFWALDEYEATQLGCDAGSGYLDIPNRNTRWLVGGTCRINDGPDSLFPPSDGKWDELEEDFSHSVSGFEAWINTVTVQVGNCVGYGEDFQIQVYYDVTVTQLRDFSVSRDDSGVEIEWEFEEVSDGAHFFVLRAIVADAGAADGSGAGDEFRDLHGTAACLGGPRFSFTDTDCEPRVTYRYRVDVSDEDGRRVLFGTEPVRIPVPRVFLHQNYPNPFNPSTEITFRIPSDMRGRLEIFDARGRSVVTLVDGVREPEVRTAEWDGRNRHGRAVDSGIYYCRLRADREAFTRKMVLPR